MPFCFLFLLLVLSFFSKENHQTWPTRWHFPSFFFLHSSYLFSPPPLPPLRKPFFPLLLLLLLPTLLLYHPLKSKLFSLCLSFSLFQLPPFQCSSSLTWSYLTPFNFLPTDPHISATPLWCTVYYAISICVKHAMSVIDSQQTGHLPRKYLFILTLLLPLSKAGDHCIYIKFGFSQSITLCECSNLSSFLLYSFHIYPRKF